MYVSCSWDDGESDSRVVKVLKYYNLKATFYPSYWWILKPYYTDLYEGFEVGNHTFNHLDLTKISLEMAKEQILKMEEVIQESTGIKPTSFAFPFGKLNQELHDLVISLGYHYTRGTKKTIDDLSFIGPDAEYGANDFWDKYHEALNFGHKCFVFYGHAKWVYKERFPLDIQKMLNDGCEFITHNEFMKRRKIF